LRSLTGIGKRAKVRVMAYVPYGLATRFAASSHRALRDPALILVLQETDK
jgi:hypothetical protein